ncbi:DNA topoisomerase III [Kingella kingae]|uniref:DNA topoisomerase n=1 Tax=Kingella kingae TaxID=504 RepID=UPI00050A321A|nr:DNA topoisomerase [Kingella kingae]MDK4526730.1 DNA topoisomerase III [Kingella kingae]MDK4532765.1 DNA topoisomerase III [Kingella kingae]
MSKTLIIAEKPNMAKEIATALGVPRQQNIYENQTIVISNCIGHLVDLSVPELADKNAPLPIIPQPFQLQAKENTLQQFDLLKKLLHRADVSVVVNACDAEREGESIFYRVYELAGCTKPVKRMWILSTTKDSYLDAWRNLRDGAETHDLYLSAKSRAEADWLLGINGSRAVFNAVGRVMTPTLAMVVDAYQANQNFKPQDYWEIHGNFTVQSGDFTAKLLNNDNKIAKFDDLALAKSALANIQPIPDFTVKDEFSLTKKAAPYLFSATALQKEANKKLGSAADKTLSIMQSLYQDFKCLTYPRSDFDALPEDFLPTINQTLDGLGKLQEYQETIILMKQNGLIVQNPRVFDNSRIDSHYAIVPTGFIVQDGKELALSQLSDFELKQILPADEYAIFNMVALRTLAAFYPPAEYAVTTRTAQAGDLCFQTTGKVLKSLGWLEVYGGVDDDDEKTCRLPEIQNGETTLSHHIDLKALKTTAPKLLTDATLLSSMETAGRKLDDKSFSNIMKETGGLGTAATRPPTIAKLKEAKGDKPPFVIVEKNQLVPTTRAIELIEHLRKHYPDLVSPAVTAQWEQKLAQMAKGQYSREQFMAEIETTTRDLVRILQGNKMAFAGTNLGENVKDWVCPCCAGSLKDKGKLLECACGFKLWKTISSKTLTDNQIKALIEKGETDEIKGFVAKSGKSFNAKLKIDLETKQVKFDFH